MHWSGACRTRLTPVAAVLAASAFPLAGLVASPGAAHAAAPAVRPVRAVDTPAGSASRAAGLSPAVSPDGMQSLHGAHRVVEVSAVSRSATYATVRRYQLVDSHWQRVGPAYHARIGRNGLSVARHRHEGDGTTPMGSYGFVFDFGSRPDPGVSGLRYRALVPGSCWAGSRRHYNRWVHRTPCGPRDEDLWASRAVAYRYAAVIGFDYAHPVYGRGSGIFLHERLHAATSGCVSLHEPALLTTLRWLRGHSRIVIGTPSSLRALRR